MTYPEWARIVDWDEAYLVDEEEPETRWTVEGFLMAGSSNALYGDMKAGKTLLLQDIAAGLAAGTSVLGLPPGPRMPVLYLDYENHVRNDVVPRLRDMGHGPEALRGWLHYASFPFIEPMDTSAGGQQVCELAAATRPALIIIDTTSRVIQGSVQSPDTIGDLARHTLFRLKGAGHTVIRIDHEGKDPSRGQVGANAKNADVDTVWHMTEVQRDTVFRLHAEYHRSPETADIRIRRAGGSHRPEPGPLRHVIESGDLTPAQQELAAALDAAGIPRDAGRPQVRDLMKSRQMKARSDDLAVVIRWRRTGGTVLPAQTVGQPMGQQAQTASDLLGQQLGQVGQRTWDSSPPLWGGQSSPGPGSNGAGRQMNGNDGADFQALWQMANKAGQRRKG